jgi:hypothetical protein
MRHISVWNLSLELLALTNNPERKKRLRTELKNQRPDILAQRVDIKKRIDDLQVDGKVWVYKWSRDCDQFESDDIDLIPATITAYICHINRLINSAEGAWKLFPISIEEANEYKPFWRDIAAEQMGY